MGQDFSLAPQGGAKMGLDFLNNISILAYFIQLNVVLYLYFVVCYTMSFFIYLFIVIVLLNAWIYYSIFSKN